MQPGTPGLGLIAAGSVTGASGVAPIAGGVATAMQGVVPGASGVGGVTRTGAGVYTIQLSEVCTSADGYCAVTPLTSNIIARLGGWTAGGLLTINTFLGSTGAATDSDFTFMVTRTQVG